MVLRTYLAGKLHGLRLTDKNIEYQGSITLSREYLEAANIAPFEAVQVVNVTTGARLMTYAMQSEEQGVCVMNGGAARLAEVGDKLIVMAFAQSDRPIQPRIVLLDEDNQIARVHTGDLAELIAEMGMWPSAEALGTC
jgi:aspartate 1-decarboxylase